MEIIGCIIGFLIIGGMLFLMLGALVVIFMMFRNSYRISKEEKKGIYYLHDGWKDGTWYGGSGD